MDFDFNKLNNLRIHELRDLARNVGVKSPTSLKKEQLIEQVLLILSGEQEPHVNTTKQGRPAKSQHHIDELVDFFVPKFDQMSQTSNTADYELHKEDDGFAFFANAPKVNYNVGAESQTVKGYLDIHQNGYGIVRVKSDKVGGEDVFLHLYRIKTHNLQTGDYLEGEVKLIQEGRPRVMVNVITVNNEPVENMKNRVLFKELPYNKLDSALQVKNTDNILKQYNILQGARVMFFKHGGYSSPDIASIVTELDDSYCVFVLNLNAKPEEAKPEKDNLFVRDVYFNVEDSIVVMVTNLIIEQAKRRLEQNKKVVVVINQLSRFVKALNSLENDDYYSSLKSDVVNNVKNFVMCAKNINKENNLTLLVLENSVQEQNMLNFLKFDLANAFNNVIEL